MHTGARNTGPGVPDWIRTSIFIHYLTLRSKRRRLLAQPIELQDHKWCHLQVLPLAIGIFSSACRLRSLRWHNGTSGEI
jgi:hypothetical protein